MVCLFCWSGRALTDVRLVELQNEELRQHVEQTSSAKEETEVTLRMQLGRLRARASQLERQWKEAREHADENEAKAYRCDVRTDIVASNQRCLFVRDLTTPPPPPPSFFSLVATLQELLRQVESLQTDLNASTLLNAEKRLVMDELRDKMAAVKAKAERRAEAAVAKVLCPPTRALPTLLRCRSMGRVANVRVPWSDVLSSCTVQAEDAAAQAKAELAELKQRIGRGGGADAESGGTGVLSDGELVPAHAHSTVLQELALRRTELDEVRRQLEASEARAAEQTKQVRSHGWSARHEQSCHVLVWVPLMRCVALRCVAPCRWRLCRQPARKRIDGCGWNWKRPLPDARKWRMISKLNSNGSESRRLESLSERGS